MLLLLLLAVLFLGPWSPFNPSDDTDETSFDCPRIAKPPAPPDGLQLISDVRNFNAGRCEGAVPTGPVAITMPIEAERPGRGLGFYTFSEDRWQRLAGAELTEDSKYARAVVDRVPENGAIMRRDPSAFQVMATAPQSGTLHPEAVRLATVAGGTDFVPAPDGSAINGNATNLKRGDATLLVPVVRGTDGAEAEAVNTIVAAPERRQAHAAALARAVQGNRLDGIELAYTRVDPARRGDFTDLVRQAAEAVHGAGGMLIVTLPLPTREGNAWNTGAYDWNQLGRLADYIKIAVERDQSIYRRVVPEALTYLTEQTDAKKLLLTLSPLSAEKSDDGIRTLNTLEALSIAAQFSVRDRERAATNADITLSADNLTQEGGGPGGLNWDALAAAVSFFYRSGDVQRTIWLENQYSAAFKAEFAQLWGLGGVAVDDASASEALADIWPAVAALAEGTTLPLLQPNSGLLRPEWLVDNRPYQAGRSVIVWQTPPEPGAHTITLVVGEGTMRVQSSTRVSLRAAAPAPAGSPTPTPTAGAPGAAPAASPRPPGATPAPVATPTATPRR